jgi:predicted ArsR family transcriptional regulator
VQPPDAISLEEDEGRPFASRPPHAGQGPPPRGLRSRDVPRSTRLVEVLVREGPLAPGSIAAHLGLSRTAVVRQLATLGRAGLVTRRAVPHGVGRPRHLYDVTPGARRLLPDGFERLARSITEAARDVGGQELLERIFAARRRRLAAEIGARFAAEGLGSADLAARASALARIQDELGYVAEVVDERGLRLRQHACPILSIAETTPAACDAELRLFGEVLGADVERETHLASGGRVCTYRIWGRGRDFRPAVWVSGQMRFDPVGPEPTPTAEPGPAWDAAQMRSAPGGGDPGAGCGDPGAG